MSDTFSSMVVKRPPGPAVGGFKALSAAEAAEIAENAGCRTQAVQLLGIVNTRIQRESNEGKRELTASAAFAGLIKPADDGTKRAVLLKLAESKFTVENAEGDPDEAVIRW